MEVGYSGQSTVPDTSMMLQKISEQNEFIRNLQTEMEAMVNQNSDLTTENYQLKDQLMSMLNRHDAEKKEFEREMETAITPEDVNKKMELVRNSFLAKLREAYSHQTTMHLQCQKLEAEVAEWKEHSENLESEFDHVVGSGVNGSEGEISMYRDRLALMGHERNNCLQQVADLENVLRQKDEEMVRFMNDQNESRNVLLQNKDYIIQQLQAMYDQNTYLEGEKKRKEIDVFRDRQNERLIQQKFQSFRRSSTGGQEESTPVVPISTTAKEEQKHQLFGMELPSKFSDALNDTINSIQAFGESVLQEEDSNDSSFGIVLHPNKFRQHVNAFDQNPTAANLMEILSTTFSHVIESSSGVATKVGWPSSETISSFTPISSTQRGNMEDINDDDDDDDDDDSSSTTSDESSSDSSSSYVGARRFQDFTVQEQLEDITDGTADEAALALLEESVLTRVEAVTRSLIDTRGTTEIAEPTHYAAENENGNRSVMPREMVGLIDEAKQILLNSELEKATMRDKMMLESGEEAFATESMGTSESTGPFSKDVTSHSMPNISKPAVEVPKSDISLANMMGREESNPSIVEDDLISYRDEAFESGAKSRTMSQPSDNVMSQSMQNNNEFVDERPSSSMSLDNMVGKEQTKPLLIDDEMISYRDEAGFEEQKHAEFNKRLEEAKDALLKKDKLRQEQLKDEEKRKEETNDAIKEETRNEVPERFPKRTSYDVGDDEGSVSNFSMFPTTCIPAPKLNSSADVLKDFIDENRATSPTVFQYQILLLWHATRCKKAGRSYDNHHHHDDFPADFPFIKSIIGLRKNCFAPRIPCIEVQKLCTHIATCRNGQTCNVEHCVSSRYVLSHHRHCIDKECAVCVTVKKIQSDSKKRERMEKNQILALQEEAAASVRSQSSPKDVQAKRTNLQVIDSGSLTYKTRHVDNGVSILSGPNERNDIEPTVQNNDAASIDEEGATSLADESTDTRSKAAVHDVGGSGSVICGRLALTENILSPTTHGSSKSNSWFVPIENNVLPKIGANDNTSSPLRIKKDNANQQINNDGRIEPLPSNLNRNEDVRSSLNDGDDISLTYSTASGTTLTNLVFDEAARKSERRNDTEKLPQVSRTLLSQVAAAAAEIARRKIQAAKKDGYEVTEEEKQAVASIAAEVADAAKILNDKRDLDLYYLAECAASAAQKGSIRYDDENKARIGAAAEREKITLALIASAAAESARLINNSKEMESIVSYTRQAASYAAQAARTKSLHEERPDGQDDFVKGGKAVAVIAAAVSESTRVFKRRASQAFVSAAEIGKQVQEGGLPSERERKAITIVVNAVAEGAKLLNEERSSLEIQKGTKVVLSAVDVREKMKSLRERFLSKREQAVSVMSAGVAKATTLLHEREEHHIIRRRGSISASNAADVAKRKTEEKQIKTAFRGFFAKEAATSARQLIDRKSEEMMNVDASPEVALLASNAAINAASPQKKMEEEKALKTACRGFFAHEAAKSARQLIDMKGEKLVDKRSEEMIKREAYTEAASAASEVAMRNIENKLETATWGISLAAKAEFAQISTSAIEDDKLLERKKDYEQIKKEMSYAAAEVAKIKIHEGERKSAMRSYFANKAAESARQLQIRKSSEDIRKQKSSIALAAAEKAMLKIEQHLKKVQDDASVEAAKNELVQVVTAAAECGKLLRKKKDFEATRKLISDAATAAAKIGEEKLDQAMMKLDENDAIQLLNEERAFFASVVADSAILFNKKAVFERLKRTYSQAAIDTADAAAMKFSSNQDEATIENDHSDFIKAGKGVIESPSSKNNEENNVEEFHSTDREDTKDNVDVNESSKKTPKRGSLSTFFMLSPGSRLSSLFKSDPVEAKEEVEDEAELNEVASGFYSCDEKNGEGIGETDTLEGSLGSFLSFEEVEAHDGSDIEIIERTVDGNRNKFSEKNSFDSDPSVPKTANNYAGKENNDDCMTEAALATSDTESDDENIEDDKDDQNKRMLLQFSSEVGAKLGIAMEEEHELANTKQKTNSEEEEKLVSYDVNNALFRSGKSDHTFLNLNRNVIEDTQSQFCRTEAATAYSDEDLDYEGDDDDFDDAAETEMVMQFDNNIVDELEEAATHRGFMGGRVHTMPEDVARKENLEVTGYVPRATILKAKIDEWIGKECDETQGQRNPAISSDNKSVFSVEEVMPSNLFDFERRDSMLTNLCEIKEELKSTSEESASLCDLLSSNENNSNPSDACRSEAEMQQVLSQSEGGNLSPASLMPQVNDKKETLGGMTKSISFSAAVLTESESPQLTSHVENIASENQSSFNDEDTFCHTEAAMATPSVSDDDLDDIDDEINDTTEKMLIQFDGSFVRKNNQQANISVDGTSDHNGEKAVPLTAPQEKELFKI
eukprot:CAMPEP_0194417624 /NCGR_PEP_ID=MMETSP0176-20130528/16732_1 /TAXON_ID=216777 /ORGANISM="Proboscia alata, Strain PI-D3" /LENGTH=2372 /DNA_ID=CAMNT_0039223645 /DNA_START=241 /DNA_END=7360 /DNA_ORIENTATION=+